jgi:hypothetical protein
MFDREYSFGIECESDLLDRFYAYRIVFQFDL